MGSRAAAGYEISSFLKQKFTGKERDEGVHEAGFDYFLAWYYSNPLARFATPDAPFADQSTADPQSWNLYAYVRSSPLKYLDPTGREIVGSGSHGEVVMEENDFTESVGNVATGVLADAINFVSDTINYNTKRLNDNIGTDIKQIPLIAPENETQANSMKFGEAGLVAAIPGPKGSKGTKGETAAAAYGRQAHGEFGTKVNAKPGWKSEPSLKDPATGKTVKRDAVTKNGRPIELKPSTPSGRAAGRQQLKNYERAAGKKGRVVYYKSETSQN